jgi:plastocyanin
VRRRAGGRLQTVGAAFLVLAITVAPPALSAAQEDSVPEGPPVTTPAPAPGEAPQPGDPAAQPEQDVTSEATTETDVTRAGAKEPRARPSATKTVSVGDNFYKPRTITIDVGDTVTWRNDGQADHTATADNGSFDTGTFGPGERRSETFSEAGNVPYYCIIHGTAQSGTIKVRSASGGGGGGGDGGGSGGSSSSSGTSEAAAVSSPGAAGSSSSLPATGFAALALGAIGLVLIASGSVVRRVEGRPRRGSRLFSL